MSESHNVAIRVSNVSKSFKLPHESQNSIKGKLINFRKRGYEIQEALNDVSFEVKKGEFFGIVGRNGSGKSTLLKILAGIYAPTSGSIEIEGKLTPFIELGVGFNPELSGRDNVFLNGALLGFSRKEMEAMYDDIVEFAEIERFMDQKLKNYSSGMQVRLAFSIAIRAESDILVLDEVLAVGDTNFQKKCFDVFRNLKKAGRTIILVTHDMSAVENFCDRALLISTGKVISIGTSAKIAKLYNQQNIEAFSVQTNSHSGKNKKKQGEYRPVKILKTIMRDEHGDLKKTVYEPNERIVVDVECVFNEDIEKPIIGVTLKDANGQRLFDTNTRVAHIDTGRCKVGDIRKVRFSLQNILSDGKYTVHSAVASQDATIFYDIEDEAAVFTTGGWEFPSALIQPDSSVSLMKEEKK
jgi:ABC-2 type transport system ATP-binding protein